MMTMKMTKMKMKSCECSCEDNMHGFTMTKNTDNGYSSISFYSTDKICADEMKHLMDALKF